MKGIRLDAVHKVYGASVRAVNGVTLNVHPGEFMVLVGPSGCGKSTLLRMIAGLETVTSGSISVGDKDITNVAPQHRDIAMVFQNYALYPHMTVRENIAFGLKIRREPKSEARRLVESVAEELGLTELLDRHPSALSGGQRQRVAMGRAMVRRPAAFLLDEPLSNLDAALRVSMRASVRALHERLGATTVYVTHDQVEAMTLGDRVAVLRDGVLQQCDTPQTLFDHPANLFVAAFLGSPAMNFAHGTASPTGLSFAGFTVPAASDSGDAGITGDVIVGVRPEDLHLAASDDPGAQTVRVLMVEQLGAEVLVLFEVDSDPIGIDALAAARAGESPNALLGYSRHAVFTARIPGRPSISPGEELALVADPRHVHTFSPESYLALSAFPGSGAVGSLLAQRQSTTGVATIDRQPAHPGGRSPELSGTGSPGQDHRAARRSCR